MTSYLVLNVLNFTGNHTTTVPPWTDPWIRPQNPSSSSIHSVTVLGTQRAPLTKEPNIDEHELKLPKMRSLVIMICANLLLETTLYIVISSGSEYTKYLGGSATFSGLVLGVPAIISRMALGPLVRRDGGTYKFPLHLCCATALVGGILYALAYRAHFLYLVLISRIVTGVSFAQFMYSERYCSDPRIVGVRRRTTLAGWLVAGESTGYTVGPFVGGLLYNVGFENAIFNGYTSPGWVTAAVWLVFWVGVTVLFEDVPRRDGRQVTTPKTETGTLSPAPVEPTQDTTSPENDVPPEGNISAQQWAVTATMSWFAMTCFFVLSAWEANIPIFVVHKFGASPFVAGNLLALGGAGTFPFMFAPMALERHVQDRYILAAGCALGLLGLFVAIPVASMGHPTLGGLFACWFFVKLGFNLAKKVSLKLLHKQMPYAWNGKISMFIQYSNCSGRVSGATWGGAGVEVGMTYYLGLQFAFLGLGALMFMNLVKGNEGKVVKQVSTV